MNISLIIMQWTFLTDLKFTHLFFQFMKAVLLLPKNLVLSMLCSTGFVKSLFTGDTNDLIDIPNYDTGKDLLF